MLNKLISKARTFFRTYVVASEEDLWPNRSAYERFQDDLRLN